MAKAAKKPSKPAENGTAPATAEKPPRPSFDDLVQIVGALADGDRVDRVSDMAGDHEDLRPALERIRKYRDSLPDPVTEE